MINNGKRFENNFRDSLPSDYWFYRLRDSAASFYGGNDNLRFANTNIADNLVFNGKTLFINELKAHAGKSIPLNCIRENQAKMMSKASVYDNIKCTLFVFFYSVGRCFALDIKDFMEFLENTDRKSIPIAYFEEKAVEISVIEKKVNFRYELYDYFSNKKEEI